MNDYNDAPPRDQQYDRPQYQQRPQYQSQNGGNSNYFKPNNGGGYNGGNRSYGNNRNGGGGYNSGGGGFNGGNRNRQPQEPFDEANVKLYKAYAGTGNQDAPSDVLNKMKRLAKELEEFGYMLRVGAMNGPEEAFEAGAREVELHLPWRDFNNRQSKSYFNTPEIQTLAKMFHPTYDGLKPAIQAFLGKNVRTVLGKDLRSPVRFVIGWSEDGAELSNERTAKTGSFGHVISLAAAMKIPVFNLGKPDAESRLKHYLELPDVTEKERFTEF